MKQKIIYTDWAVGNVYKDGTIELHKDLNLPEWKKYKKGNTFKWTFKMRDFKFPIAEDMKKIRVKLEEPRPMEFKDRRKNTTQTTIIPKELKDFEKKKGVYLIFNGDKIGYVGATTNFRERMVAHIFLRKNPLIKFVYFYEEDDDYKRLLYEMVLKYYYFGKVNTEYNFAGDK